MAIKAATGYMAREGPQVVVKKPVVKKAPVYLGGPAVAPLKVPKNTTTTFNFGGGGTLAMPFTQPGASVPNSAAPSTVPGSVPDYSTPSVDTRPPASRINQPINYQPSLDEINADPTYGAALDAYNTQMASQRRQLALQIAQRAIASGYDISGALGKDPNLQQYAGDLTPDVIQQAKDNPFSDAAQTAQAYNRAISNNAYDQAARGTLGSGAQVTGRNTLDQQNALGMYQGLQSALSGIRGDVGGFLSAQDTGYQNLQSTREAVAERLSQLVGAAYPIGDDTGAYDAGYQTVPGTGGIGATGASGVPSAAPGVPGQTLPSGQTQGTGVVWNGKTITSVAQLKANLAPGVSYAQWKANHPAAAAKLEGGG